MAETKGFDLASVLKDVSNLDTGTNSAAPRQIELIPLELIDPDPNNFYSLEGIDELAGSIELLGLQQPLLVRPSGGGRYTIISGHRRRAAILLIIDGGSELFAGGVPCLVDRSEASAALRELQLIYANSDTRKLTSAELSKQAERVEALLYELKEQGLSFPGRMRDHVAEACKLSKSKLARLKVIQKNLAPFYMPAYEAGKLSESVAYALAQQTPETQMLVKKYCVDKKSDLAYLREWQVKDVSDDWAKLAALPCKKCGGSCKHAGVMLDAIQARNSYTPCRQKGCCGKCSELGTCKFSCPEFADKVKKLKADKREAKRQEKLAQAEKERPDIEKITALWRRFGEARKAAQVNVKKFMKAEKVCYNSSDDKLFSDLENSRAKINLSTHLPYGYSMSLSEVEYLIAAADCFGCSVDYLLCRTDEPSVNCGSNGNAPVEWHTGTPPQSGMYVVQFQDSGVPFTDLVYFHSAAGKFTYSKFERDTAVNAEVLAWVQIPEVDNG